MSGHWRDRVRARPDGSIEHWDHDRWVVAVPGRTVRPAGTTWARPPDPSPFPTLEVLTMSSLMRTEPVLVLLNGLAAVVNLVLLAAVAVGAVSLDGAQVAAVVTAVQAVANLVGAVVRAAVVSPATDQARTDAARMAGRLARVAPPRDAR